MTSATLAAFGCGILLSDYHFTNVLPLGLDYFSTFLVGLYTQPLGFILLLAWLFFYLNTRKFDLSFALSVFLLALIILANFFAAVTACFFLAASFGCEAFKLFRQNDFARRKAVLLIILLKTSIPILSLALTAFWLVPMISQSDYFVTRPSLQPLSSLIPAAMWLWYILALLGFGWWLRDKTEEKIIYLAACLFLFIAIFIFAPLAPGWFPIQSNRFLQYLRQFFSGQIVLPYVVAVELITYNIQQRICHF